MDLTHDEMVSIFVDHLKQQCDKVSSKRYFETMTTVNMVYLDIFVDFTFSREEILNNDKPPVPYKGILIPGIIFESVPTDLFNHVQNIEAYHSILTYDYNLKMRFRFDEKSLNAFAYKMRENAFYEALESTISN